MKAEHSKPNLGRRTTALLSASVGALVLATPAVAQEETSAGTDVIVVTAQFREQNLQDTPLSITAVSSEMLEARNQDSLIQVAYQAPNVILNSMSSTFGTGIGAQIRGVGQFDFNPALEPAVGIYIDDVYYASLVGANMDLLDLERVEILRGPQGTLAGRNTAGGAIRLISKKPNGDGSGYVSAGYGAFNAVDVRASADFGLTDDLAIRISGVHKESDGYIKRIDYGCAVPGNSEGIAPTIGTSNCVVDRLGSTNYTGIRTQVEYEPTDRLAVTIIGDYTSSDETAGADTTAVAANPNFICGPYCTYADFRLTGPAGDWTTGDPQAPDTFQSPRRTYSGWGVSGKIAYDLSDNLQFESISAYREYNTKFGTDDDFSPQLVSQAGGANELDFNFFSQEIRLNGSLADGLAEFTIGGFYHDQKTTYYTLQDIRYIVPGLSWQFIGNDPVNADSKAVFATVILHPAENLNLTGGIRYTDEHKDYTFSRSQITGAKPAFLTGALDGFTADYDGSKVDYRASIDYRFSDAFLAYATVATGFKGGGVTPRPFNVGQAQFGAFDPETVTNYEIGFKSDLLDNRLRLNVAGFISKYKNIQLPLRDCSFANPGDMGPCGMIQNAGDATFKGVEAEVLIVPNDTLQIDASGSWLDSKYDSVLPAAGGGTILFPGDPATNAPEWKFSLGVQNDFALGGNKGTLTPRFDISYVDERYVGNALGFDYFLPDYFLGNARITWRNPDEDLSIALGVTNLFDKYYTTWRFDAVAAFSGNAQDAVGRPREWMLTVRKEF